MKREFRIGTRGSALALAQSGEIRRSLAARFKNVRFRLVVIKTEGDEFQSVEIFRAKGIGLFTKAIEKKLLEGKVDAAVHSLKDLPTSIPSGLSLAAVTKRLDAGDVLLTRGRKKLSALPSGAVVGTGSPRRIAQLRRLRPDLDVRPMRGNLDTRVRKVVRERAYDAIVVAGAGLERLGRYRKYARPIPQTQILPAIGQAALAVQVRSKDREALRMMRALNHAGTESCVGAERAFLKALGGGCRVPAGASTKIRAGKLTLEAAVFSVRPPHAQLRGTKRGPVKHAEKLGAALGRELLRRGAGKFLREARSARHTEGGQT